MPATIVWVATSALVVMGGRNRRSASVGDFLKVNQLPFVCDVGACLADHLGQTLSGEPVGHAGIDFRPRQSTVAVQALQNALCMIGQGMCFFTV